MQGQRASRRQSREWEAGSHAVSATGAQNYTSGQGQQTRHQDLIFRERTQYVYRNGCS